MGTTEAVEAKLLEIVDAVRSLTPEQRRRLVRRLRISGLWDPEDLVSDRDRLRVAPALGLLSQIPDSAAADVLQTTRESPPHAEVSSAPEEIAATKDEYRPAVSSKVVVAGDAESQAEARQRMAPVPGQAPEEPIVIIFDGGTRGDPPLGYGSYAIRWPGVPQQVVRLRFGDDVSGPEAEYDTLIAALEATLQRLQDHGAVPEAVKLDIRGDSTIVLRQIRGQTEIEEPQLQVRCDRARYLLRRFGSWSLSRYHRNVSAETPES